MKNIIKTVIDTITDPELLSSRPHHMECTDCKGHGELTILKAKEVFNFEPYANVALTDDERLSCPSCKGTGTMVTPKMAEMVSTGVQVSFTLPESFPGIVDIKADTVEQATKEYLALLKRKLVIEPWVDLTKPDRIECTACDGVGYDYDIFDNETPCIDCHGDGTVIDYKDND
tara:strand:- start:367 stop:885 length:519 start_codon:yes stop_codon:yes gene_type:complete